MPDKDCTILNCRNQDKRSIDSYRNVCSIEIGIVRLAIGVRLRSHACICQVPVCTIVHAVLDDPSFDGHQAVDFIIEQAHMHKSSRKLTLIAVGKLTNVALAFQKAPEIIPNIRLMWLGSNYPDPGEYNLMDDIPSMNYILDSGVQFEIVTVGARKNTGTDAVRISKDQAVALFSGRGPHIDRPVIGRHGGEFYCFGDYSANLFQNIRLGKGGTRALYDMCAVAIVKNPAWAEARQIPAPTMIDGVWVSRPDNPVKITLWEHFDRKGIITDFISALCPDQAPLFK